MDINSTPTWKIKRLVDVPHLYAELIQLIEHSFGYRSPYRFSIDFYPLVCPGNWEHLYLLIHPITQELVGHVGVKLRSLCLGAHQFPVATLGGIAIKEKYRGQGLLHFLLPVVLKEYEKQVTFFLLWSNLVDLYQRYQFSLAIGQRQNLTKPYANFGLEIITEGHFHKTLYKNLTPAQKDMIQNLHEGSIVRPFLSFKRSVADWEDIEHITSSELYFHYGENQIIDSYFFMHKGMDLTQIIHEVGFQQERQQSILQLLSSYSLWRPEEENTILAAGDLHYMGLLRQGDQTYLNNFIKIWGQGQVQLLNLDMEKVEFYFNQQIYTTSMASFFTYIFGPNPLQEFKHLFVPIYIPGLDSI